MTRNCMLFLMYHDSCSHSYATVKQPIVAVGNSMQRQKTNVARTRESAVSRFGLERDNRYNDAGLDTSLVLEPSQRIHLVFTYAAE